MTAAKVDPATATSDDVLRIQRRTNKWGAAFVIVVISGGGWLIHIATSNRDAVNVAFASQRRSACITERRNQEESANGDVNEASLLAGYLSTPITAADLAKIQVQLALTPALSTRQGQIDFGIEAITRRRIARDSLVPSTLNQKPPVGCGPPITSTDQIKTEGNP